MKKSAVIMLMIALFAGNAFASAECKNASKGRLGDSTTVATVKGSSSSTSSNSTK